MAVKYQLQHSLPGSGCTLLVIQQKGTCHDRYTPDHALLCYTYYLTEPYVSLLKSLR